MSDYPPDHPLHSAHITDRPDYWEWLHQLRHNPPPIDLSVTPEQIAEARREIIAAQERSPRERGFTSIGGVGIGSYEASKQTTEMIREAYRPVQLHDFVPDFMAMGDCLACGNVSNSPIHRGYRPVTNAYDRAIDTMDELNGSPVEEEM